MWFLIWLKFLLLTMVGFAALIACGLAMFLCGRWIDRKFAMRIPGVLVSVWLFYSLYFSIVWTWLEILKTHP